MVKQEFSAAYGFVCQGCGRDWCKKLSVKGLCCQCRQQRRAESHPEGHGIASAHTHTHTIEGI